METENNADPHRSCSPTANSSLNRGPGESTSATGFMLKHDHSEISEPDDRHEDGDEPETDQNEMERDCHLACLLKHLLIILFMTPHSDLLPPCACTATMEMLLIP